MNKHNPNCRLGCKHFAKRQKNGRTVNNLNIEKIMDYFKNGIIAPNIASQMLEREYGIYT